MGSGHTMYMIAGAGLTTHETAMLLLSLGILLGTARLLGETARRLGQPAVLGELLAGILLGPTVLGTISPDLFAWLFTDSHAARIALDGYILISVVLLLLISGLEIELTTAYRQGKAALIIAMTGMLLPFTIGSALGWQFPTAFGPLGSAYQPLAFAIFLGIALSITALPVIAKVLMDLNIFKSDLGMLIMSAAMFNDLAGWLGFAVVMALINPGENGGASIGGTLLLTMGFLAGVMTIGRWLTHRALVFIQAYGSWPGGVIGFVLVVALLCAAATEAIGIHSILGAFFAGIVIGDSKHLRQRTRETIHQFIANIFAPVFFAGIGLTVNFVAAFNPLVVLLAVLVACLGKVAGCYVGSKWAGLGRRDSLAVSSGMLAQGTMGIILGQLALTAELITQELFVAIVFVALLSTVISGPAIQRVLQRGQKRSLGDLLTEDRFVSVMKSLGARAAIRELSSALGPDSPVEADAVFESVWKREQTMRTGLGDGLAIPHARLAGLEKTIVIIGRSPHGVDFDAADGNPAHLICMLLTPLDDQDSQLEVLRLIAECFHDPARRSAALNAGTYTEFLAAIKLPGADSHGGMAHE